MSLKAWYPLIDGSLENKGLDTTPLTLHGTIPFTDGRVRTAPTFSANKSNYYTMPPITKTNNFSVCCWVKCSSVTSSWIFWQGVIGSINLGFNITSLGKLQYVCSPKIIVTDLPLNTWIHICMTIDDNGYMNCYLNSENVGSASTNGFNYTEGDDLYIGLAKIVYPFNGQLQDFRYYDHCLSPKEVKEIAKGLCLHLPLKGTNARPNLFKNSATMFDYVGHYNPTLSTAELVFDETSPCGTNGKVLKLSTHRNADYTYNYAGTRYDASEINMNKLEIGKTYCVSIWIKGDTNETSLILNTLAAGQRILKISNEKLTPEWKRYYAIFTAKSETFVMAIYLLYSTLPQTGNVNWSVCCPKLELLSPTPYIPNVDDTQYSDYVLDYEPDCSGNEFDATKYGGLTTSDSNGRYNTAVTFNGTNTYLQGLAPTNSECKEFTIATWVKLNNVSTSHTLYACRTVAGQGVALFYSGASGIRLDDGVDNAAFPNSTLEPDKWYHIAVTRDTTTRKLYINGEFISSGATTGALVNMGTMYQIGESNAQTTTQIGNFLNGTISDFRLYTSALSADDVKELYETSVSIAHNPPSLTESAYYNYVEGQKHSTFDKSKFTVVGSPTITNDGVASGFSANSYLKIHTGDWSWSTFVISCKFTTSSDISGTQLIYGDGYSGLYLYDKSLSIKINYIDQSGKYSTLTNVKTGLKVQPNTTYYTKLLFDGTGYKVLFSVDGVQFILCYSDSKIDVATFRSFFIGKNASMDNFKGRVYLNYFSIVANGVEFLNFNKTGIDQIKEDNYTVVGSPVISGDGIVSGFSDTNYITIPNLNITGVKDFELITPIFKVNQIESGINQIQNWSNYNNTKLNTYVRATGSFECTILQGSTNIIGRVIETNISYNTPYQVKFSYKNSVWNVYYKKGDGDWIQTISDRADDTGVTIDGARPLGWQSVKQYLQSGSIDLNSFKIYVDGNLVYQPCLKIPYTLGSTGIKIVDSTYLDRVKDVYDQHYPERYYTIDETTQTVYEVPVNTDKNTNFYVYEYDEGLQASIKKTGIANFTDLREVNNTMSIKQNLTEIDSLIEK